MIDVVVDRNYIEACGQRINRPHVCPPGQWLDFWRPVDGGHQAELDRINGDGFSSEPAKRNKKR